MPAKQRYRSLAASLDYKILTLVRQYVDDKVEEQDPDVIRNGTLRLSVLHLYQYIQTVGDASIQRTKKPLLEKAIKSAIKEVEEELKEKEDLQNLDSDFEGLEVEELQSQTIGVKDMNAANKRITELWDVGRSQPSTAFAQQETQIHTVGTQATVAELLEPMEYSGQKKAYTGSPKPAAAAGEVKEPGDAVTTTALPRKRKEKLKEREGAIKRQKAEKDNRAPPVGVSLADIGGVESIVEEIEELIWMPLVHPEIYTFTGIQPPRGILLHGPPGCGKTMIANAVAGELGFPFLSISAPTIVSGMSGESEKKLRELFDEAKEKAPCIVFLDEIDAITPKRESAQREMERRIVAQMLTCMDDLTLEKTNGKPVMVIGATNRPDSLDPALRRAGRFDREICLNVPDDVGREKILKVLCRNLRLSGAFDFRALAKKTPGFVGADLNALTTAAGVEAIKRIFHTLKRVPLSSVPPTTITTPLREIEGGSETMIIDIDQDTNEALTPIQSENTLANTPPEEKRMSLKLFLKNYPTTLTPEQLEPLHITMVDFLTALPKVQPSSKREGFATVPDVTWQDIGALESIRVELQMAIVQPIKRPELYASVGMVGPTGVLLWGPPGCGKTLLAKAVANESRANFISVRGPELLNKYVGESERAVRQVFNRARHSVPCVIFFDELDALVPKREDTLSESSARVVNTLLTELDGLNDRKGIYVVGATNRPDVIDPAMLRPGRFDKPLFVDLPTPEERVEILKTLTKKTPIGHDVDLASIARDRRCTNFSGADLAALIREAATASLRRTIFANIQNGETDINPYEDGSGILVTMMDFEVAFTHVKPSVKEEHRAQYAELHTWLASGK